MSERISGSALRKYGRKKKKNQYNNWFNDVMILNIPKPYYARKSS